MSKSIALAICLICSAFPQLARADDPHQAIHKYLDTNVFAVGWIDLREVDVSELSAFLEKIDASPMSTEQREQRASIREALVQLDVTRVYFIVDAANLSRGPEAAVLPTTKPQATALLLRSLGGPESYRTVEDGNVVLTGNADQVAAIQNRQSEPSPQLLEAMAACKGPHGAALALPTELLAKGMRFAKTIWDDKPTNLAAAAQALTSVRWAAVSGTLPPTHATIELKSNSPESAQHLAKTLNQLAQDRLQERANALKFQSQDASVRLAAANADQAAAQLMSLRQLVVSRPTPSNNLKHIALALHNFCDVYRHFPPQSLVDDQGQRLLSWRVLILPFLDQAALYDQFHLDEPWDSPHNLKLAQQIPEVYKSGKNPADGQPPKTQIVAPLTAQTAFGIPGAPIWFSDVIDGTSNSIWLVETTPEKAVVWTKPEDLKVDTAQPFDSLSSANAAGFWTSFIDGSVRYISRETSKETLNALLTINGKEVK